MTISAGRQAVEQYGEQSRDPFGPLVVLGVGKEPRQQDDVTRIDVAA